jgi:hypothetical protein
MGGANTQEDLGFQQWKSQYAPNDTGTDYDLRGAYQAGLKPDADRGHFPDTFKMTNHPTFSVESKYSTTERPGGTWGTDASGKDTFTPSSWMASDTNRMQKLQEYFKKAEPTATLIIPKLQPTTTMGGSNPNPTETAKMMPHMKAANFPVIEKEKLSPQTEAYQKTWKQADAPSPEFAKQQAALKEAQAPVSAEAFQKTWANPTQTPNFFGRDAKKPSSEDDIETGIRNAEQK